MKLFDKDPDDRLDYFWDWTEWLNGDTIVSVEFVIPEGLTKESQSFDDSTVTLWLSGGVLGESYVVPCTIETVGNRRKTKSGVFILQDQ